MKRNSIIIIFICFISISLGIFLTKHSLTKEPDLSYDKFISEEQISDLFCKTSDQIATLTEKTIKKAEQDLKKIIEISPNKRNFDNTIRAIDAAKNRFKINTVAIQVLSLVSPDETIRNASALNTVKLNNFNIDNFIYNKKLYESICSINAIDSLTEQETYYLKELTNEYKRIGLQKDEITQEKIKKISKEISELSLEFNQNIALDNRYVDVKIEELKGIDIDFINSLTKLDNEGYKITINSPNVTKILQECQIPNTRKKVWTEFVTKAYPKNEFVLRDLIAKRNDLAVILGYRSYADFDLEDQMAKNVNTVEDFLAKLEPLAKDKASKEFIIITKDLPSDVKLINNKLEPWDFSYVINYYKKRHLSVDEQLISEYFPIDYTLPKLFEIYERFFGLTFKKTSMSNLWHDCVLSYAVYKNEFFLGTLILDLFPRDNKFGHAGQIAIVPGMKTKNNEIYPTVALVVANFPMPTNGKPALLKRNDVIVFFHECGHAIHSLLGLTELSGASGVNTKGDFVEMPSQMLEYWMKDSQILKFVSSHYQTKEPLSDEIILKIKCAESFDKGLDTLTQIFYSYIALEFYKNGENKNINKIWESYFEKYSPFIIYKKENVRYCSIIHLSDYAAKYYGYLWSKVYAADLFDTIKKYGLFDYNIGKRYVDCILSKGGSADPYQLVKAFLRREPNTEAFFKDLGLK